MNTIKLFKFATLIVCAVFAMTFTSCTDDDNNLSTIKFNSGWQFTKRNSFWWHRNLHRQIKQRKCC